MPSARRARLALAALCVAGGPLIGFAQAQTASQITPPSFSPSLQRSVGGLAIPEGVGPTAPAGAERLSLRVGRLRIEGGTQAPDRRAAELAARLSGRTVTVADLFAAARDLEQAYAAQGLALVRVVLPAQRLRDGGAVRLRVIDGQIERIDTAALPGEIRARVAAVLAPLVGRPGLTLAEIERRVLIAGDTPGTVLRSTLAAGSRAGATVLAVEARYKPVTGLVSTDNVLAASLGTYTLGTGLDLNSPTGNGESLYVRASGAPYSGGARSFFGGEPRNRALSVGLILPLGIDGLTLTLETTDARTAPRAVPGTLGIASDFSRYSARLRYPLIRARAFTLNWDAAFDAQAERVDVITPVEAPFSLDRLRIARTGADLVWLSPTEAVVTARLSAAFGLDGLGARAAPPAGSGRAPLSRQGVRPEFQKLEAALALTQPLAEHLALDLRARAQTAFNQALPRSEQIGLANLAGLSSFDAGLFQGDAGYVVRAELQAPFVVPVTLPFGLPSIPAQLGSGLPSGDTTPGAVVIAPYAFGAFGLTRQQRPTALERAMVRGTAYGAGLRLAAAPGLSFTQAALSLELGRAERSDGLPDDTRLTFTTALQF